MQKRPTWEKPRNIHWRMNFGGVFIDTNFFIYINTPTKTLDRFIEHCGMGLSNNRTFTNMTVLDESIYLSRKN